MAEFASMTMKDLKGYLTEVQVASLIDSASNLRDRLILQLMYRCGRRVSEVLMITKDDILWDEDKIIFNILKRKKPVKEMKPVDGETMSLLRQYVDNPDIPNLKKKMDGELGIYMIWNRQNYVYVGQSTDIGKRWRQHRNELMARRHPNNRLQDDWIEFGSDNFRFDLIEKCEKDELDRREKIYVDFYNSFLNGYNRTPDGLPIDDWSPPKSPFVEEPNDDEKDE